MGERQPVHIGMLTPSSNTVVEPMVANMLSELPEVSGLAGRLRVTEISMNENSQGQFDPEPMLDAGSLLSDARVDVMGWNGTSSSWLGFDLDRELCDAITDRFGMPATTAVLAVNEILEKLGCRRIAFITPYIEEIQSRILAQYRDAGFECAAERHTGEHVNYAFAEITEDAIAKLIREVMSDAPDAVVVMCTNMRAAGLANDLEKEFDVPIIDSLAAFVWKGLKLGRVDTKRVRGWGRIFSDV